MFSFFACFFFFLQRFYFLSFFFLFPFFLVLKDSFKIISSQDTIGAYFGFLKYTRILCTSVSSSFHLWGHFFFHLFFCLFCLLQGEGGGNFAISEETLNTFNNFWRAYQSSFTRGAYLTARAFSFAVGVIRWEIGPTEADGLPMQLPTVLGTCHVFLHNSHSET